MFAIIAVVLLFWLRLGFCAPDGPTNGAQSSSAMVMTADGSRLYVVNFDSSSITAIDTARDEAIREVPIGKDPRCIALSRDERRLYVTNESAGTLTVVDTESLNVVGQISVSPEPYGVVTDPRREFVYVASAALSLIEVVDVSSLGDEAVDAEPDIVDLPQMDHPRPHNSRHYRRQRIVLRIATGPKPKGLAISADGRVLYVTHFLSGDVSVLDTNLFLPIGTISTGSDSNMSQKIVLHPQNGRAYLPHLRSNVLNPFLLFDTTIFPVVSVIDANSNRPVPRERLDLSVGAVAANLPYDLAFSPDGGTAYIANLGSGDVMLMDLARQMRVGRVEVGEGPRGIAITHDGLKAYVLNSLSDDISVVNLAELREAKRIPITTSPLSPTLKRGKVLFFSSKSKETSRDQWMSCASCHFEAEHDGRTWMTVLGPRNTTSMRGVGETRPVHWSADRDEVQDFEFTIRQLQAGTGLLRGVEPNAEIGTPNAGLSADLDALAAYVESLQPKPNPFEIQGSLSWAVHRGRAVFERPDVGCSDCHQPPYFTDSNLSVRPYVTHNVGTGDRPEERFGPNFDTPSLIGLWDSAPYLHDGSAPTLRDVLTTRNPQDRHGRTSHLTESELNDLIVFLLSL